ncbi:MAG: hypothetical protein RLZZ299_1413 [Pseudomonadota bacterium]
MAVSDSHCAMAQLTDFISRIFGAGKTQGLSGGAEVVVDPDPASAFFATWMRKHRTDEDVEASPASVWSSLSYQGKRGGLRAHLTAARTEGPLVFSDVLVILAAEDAARVGLAPGSAFEERCRSVLQDRIDAWINGERVPMPHPARRVGVLLVADGSESMLGASLGLRRGEYVTGILPNTYVGPGPKSRPAVSVYLNIPGAWEGYREVGKLWDDQLLFTLGRHWLDNVHHPALREPGLYRLQRSPDGALVHQVAPELQSRYLVRSDALESGASVVTLAERSGAPVAWVVLAVAEETAEMPSAPHAAARVEPASSRRQRTVIPGAMDGRVLALNERGALLQKVHFATFMEGYDVHIAGAGLVGTHAHDPRATLEVRGGGVSLLAREPSVRLDGLPVPLGAPVPLDAEHVLEVDGHRFEYRNLAGLDVAGWPYLGELRRAGGGAYLPFGEVHRIGRDRRCVVRLPDEAHNENIAWLASVGTGATIRSRSGEIPKSRFYTDSIMVASEHAEIDLLQEPLVRSLARHCYTFVRRGGEVFAIHPREGAPGPLELSLASGDELLVGNCLFEVGFPPAAEVGDAVAGHVAPPPLDAALAVDPAAPARSADLPDLSKGAAQGTPAAPVAPAPVRDGAERVVTGTAPRLAPPELLAPLGAEDVAAVAVTDATDACISRARLVLEGWSVEGPMVLGNHGGCQAILPELRNWDDQAFLAMDLFALRPEGSDVHVELLTPGDASMVVDGAEAEETGHGAGATLVIVRRGEDMEPAFSVALCLLPDPTLPKGWRLAIATALDVAQGLNGIAVDAETWARGHAGTVPIAARVVEGELHVHAPSDARLAWRAVDGPWMNASQGRAVMAPGDRLRVGLSIWRFEVA